MANVVLLWFKDAEYSYSHGWREYGIEKTRYLGSVGFVCGFGDENSFEAYESSYLYFHGCLRVKKITPRGCWLHLTRSAGNSKHRVQEAGGARFWWILKDFRVGVEQLEMTGFEQGYRVFVCALLEPGMFWHSKYLVGFGCLFVLRLWPGREIGQFWG